MTKIRHSSNQLPKKPSWHGNIIYTVKKNLWRLYKALKLTLCGKIELKAVHISIKADLSPALVDEVSYEAIIV